MNLGLRRLKYPVIVLFLARNIAATADVGIHKYHEDIEIHAMTTEGVAIAMKSCIRDSSTRNF